MKRCALVLLLAIALAVLLATPAAAKAPWASTFRLTPKTAYVIAYYDGSWFEVVGQGDAGFVVPHFTTYDDQGNLVAPADAIPGDYDIVMQLSWKGVNYGLVKTLPLTYQPKLSIPDAGVDMSYESARVYWAGVSLWDDWWVTNAGEIPAFNSHIGAQVYANRWFPPLTGDNGIATNLTADKKLPPGTYTVTFSEKWLRTYTGLDQSLEFVGGDWVPLKTPWHVKPNGENVGTPFTFTVAP